MADADQNLLTVGSVPKKMLAFALPIFLSNLFQQLYNAVDSLIVGKFIGEQALAAVSSSGSLILLMVGFINGLSMGAGVLIARFYGAQDDDHVERAVHTTVALGITAGAVLTVVGVILTPQILRWIGTPADVISNSILYFRIYFLGSSAVVLYNMAASILQSVGDSRSPMKYLILASLTNVVLDLLFVAVFRLGVGSAALATILSQILCASLALGRLTRTERSYRIRWRRVRFEGVMLRHVVTLGIPSGVQNSVVSLANVIVQANINAFGSSAMAGCGAYSKIEGFAFLPITCFALALSTFVSQNIGAQRYDRVRAGIKFGLLCSPILAECIGVCIYVFSPVLVSAFNDHPEVIAFGVNYAHTVSLFYFLLAFSHCCAGIMRGMGRPIVPMTIMLSVWCALRITYITLTVRAIPSIQVVYWAYPLTWTISSALFVLCLTRLRFPPMPPPKRRLLPTIQGVFPMKIIDKLKQDKVTLSFEVFPPKTSDTYESVAKATQEIAALRPDFMSVTYGAGGGTSDYTVGIAAGIQDQYGVDVLAHLTCASSTRAHVAQVLEQLKARGIQNVLALRGDIPEGGAPANDYHYAAELVRDIKAHGDFCVGGACYPEGHPESPTKNADIDHLKAKVEAGCQFLTTQMFFDNNILYNFLYRIREKGITVPVVAGIMPVTNGKQIARICKLSGTYLPERFKAIVDKFGDNPPAMRQAGVAYATDQIIDLIANGVNHIHIYSMNKPEIAAGIQASLSEILK